MDSTGPDGLEMSSVCPYPILIRFTDAADG